MSFSIMSSNSRSVAPDCVVAFLRRRVTLCVDSLLGLTHEIRSSAPALLSWEYTMCSLMFRQKHRPPLGNLEVAKDAFVNESSRSKQICSLLDWFRSAYVFRRWGEPTILRPQDFDLAGFFLEAPITQQSLG
jgi:hypothetical protein